MDALKVSSKSNPNMVAGALAGIIREGKDVCVQAIGAGAVNQAVKAIAIAGSFLSEDKIEISCCPSFVDLAINGEERTAILFKVLFHSIEE